MTCDVWEHAYYIDYRNARPKYLESFIDNLVNLVVAEDLGEVSPDEVMRVLAPLGVAYVKQGERWTKTVKPWPNDIDEWTHFLYDASNNAVSQDQAVGPPRGLQWVGGPVWARSHDHLSGISAVVSAAGRLFSIVDEGPIASVKAESKWMLVARDAMNGLLLLINAWGVYQYWFHPKNRAGD